MSDISSVYSSTSRITGLFSDLDTDSIVKDLVQVQQTKVDAKSQEKTRETWYADALAEVEDLVDEFKSTYLTQDGSGSMLTTKTYASYKTEITSGSTSAVSVSGGTTSLSGSYVINSITQLAANASVSSSGKISSDGNSISSSNTTKLSDLKFKNALTFGSGDSISFSINGKTFSFSSDTTLQNMINTVNADSDAGVTMKYSRLTDGFTIEADEGGADSTVKIQNISGNAFGENSAFGIGEGTAGIGDFGTAGQDAKLTIEGISVTRDSNTFSIDGITYTLKDTTDESIKFSVSRDTSGTVEKVKTFVTAYNELMDKLNAKLSEKDYSGDYPPLTQEQEDEMSEDEINSWNEKAKSGLLRRDSGLASFVRTVRSAFFTEVGGTGQNATNIGLTSGSYYTSDAGKIVLDGDALQQALEESPDVVTQMFTSSDQDSRGLIYKISDAVSTYSKKLDNDMDSSGEKIEKLESKIDDMEEDLDNLAERYYNKFAVMETALSKMNSQLSMLSSMFSS